MDALKKFQIVMFVAFMGFFLGLLAEKKYLPLDWEWFAKAPLFAIAAAGMFVAVVLAFLASISVDTDDLWSSWWFKYMRCIWGSNFGGKDQDKRGHTQVLCVNVCQAFWQSFFTMCFWLVNLGIWAMFTYTIVQSAMMNFFLTDGNEQVKNVVGFLAILCVLSAWFGFYVSWALLQKTRFARGIIGAVTGITLFATLFAIFLVVIPLHFISVAEYFLLIGKVLAVVGVLAIIAVTAGFVAYLVCSKIIGPTVGGVVSSGFVRSLKEKTCVMIYSKKEER